MNNIETNKQLKSDNNIRQKLNTPMSLEMAEAVTGGTDGIRYGDCDDETLAKKLIGISKALNNKNLTPEQRENYLYKANLKRENSYKKKSLSQPR